LCEKTGAIALALPGLMAGWLAWQADEIVCNIEILELYTRQNI